MGKRHKVIPNELRVLLNQRPDAPNATIPQLRAAIALVPYLEPYME